MVTTETMIAALEEQYARRFNAWMDARTDDQRAGQKEFMDRIDEMMRALRSTA